MLLAVILSIFLPGLGQIYLGLDNKGAILLVAYVVSAILILLIIGFILVIIIWIWALIDTIRSASALNRGEVVEDKLF
jgi:TM2 domain-containing membrane protein YozV